MARIGGSQHSSRVPIQASFANAGPAENLDSRPAIADSGEGRPGAAHLH
jgi:hypothetical protein